jgi:5-methylcytosine-specific restriction endonuclease McrA
MHIPDKDLFQSAYAIRNLLKINGKLVISNPLQREDLKEDSDRDSSGRLMILRTPSRIKLLFERLGFEVTSTWESADALGRSGVQWCTIVFTYMGTSMSESVDKIESIINQDRKTATYKLALLKALCDIAQLETQTVNWDGEGNVHVPVNSVVRKWIEYYWPIVSSFHFIPQIWGEHKNSEKPIAFRKSLSKLADIYGNLGGLNQFIFDFRKNEIHPDAVPIVKNVKQKIRNAIIQGPVKYAGGGSNENKPFNYNNQCIVFDAAIWRELVLLGHWIKDSISMRWAELTKALSNQTLQINDIFHLFIFRTGEDRNVTAARKLYSEKSNLECVWSGKTITSNFHVDHAIPFTLRHDNSLWNLFPVHPKLNNQKSDKLPSQQLIERKKDNLIFYWEILNNDLHDIFKSDFIRFTGNKKMLKQNWQNELFWSFTEAVETTAARRGVERWEP